MKKWFLTILVCLLLVSLVPILKGTTPYPAQWLHFSKYTAAHTLTAPYIIMRKGTTVWDASTSTWTSTGSTYTNLDVRPTWNANSNIWVWQLPQTTTVGKGQVTLTLYDAADGAEAITDVAKWGASLEIEQRENGSFRFTRLPEAF